jgi:hypothetical protein
MLFVFIHCALVSPSGGGYSPNNSELETGFFGHRKETQMATPKKAARVNSVQTPVVPKTAPAVKPNSTPAKPKPRRTVAKWQQLVMVAAKATAAEAKAGKRVG